MNRRRAALLRNLAFAVAVFWPSCRSIAAASHVPASGKPLRISTAAYQDKVYGSWLGQCAGNIYGLAHEQKYFQEPGPDSFPLGYSGWGAARMKELGGAFSDDDTDIEYMYLLAMEKHGIEPTYAQLAEYWKRHVRDKVWLANRAAVAAVHHGFTPPWTGKKLHNPHWFQIDPQLVNEIWAVTAPGMIRYATAKSAWAARVMSDEWAVEPTVAYAAMYSAAFFESDIRKLIEIGKAALPPGAKFARTIDAMAALYTRHPNDWKAARKEAIPRCYFQEPEATRTATNANLNAAFAILALLYGQGDFQRTLDIGCALGFDADNQTATLGGLLGVIHGTRGIPRALLFPYPELGWSEPFNDRYFNVTREGLPDAGLRDLAGRTAALGEKVILKGGGRQVKAAGVESYEIDAEAAFVPPFEFPAGPLPEIEAGRPVSHDFLVSGAASPPSWKIVQGSLPRGLRLDDGRLSGVTGGPPGVYPMLVEVRSGSTVRQRMLNLVVRGENLARSAGRIVAPLPRADLSQRKLLILDTPPSFFAESVEVIRDGRRYGDGATFLSLGAGSSPRLDRYGYGWERPERLGLLSFSTGFIEEVSGWFTDLNVEYLDAHGEWRPVENLVSSPPFPTGNETYNKAHFAEYLLFFDPVVTAGIRIAGPVGSAAKDRPLFTSIAELGAYGPIAGRERLRP